LNNSSKCFIVKRFVKCLDHAHEWRKTINTVRIIYSDFKISAFGLGAEGSSG
jgi:hypothetical protein